MATTQVSVVPTLTTNVGLTIPNNTYECVIYTGPSDTIYLPSSQVINIVNIGSGELTINGNGTLIQINNTQTAESFVLEQNKSVDLVLDDLWVILNSSSTTGAASFAVNPIAIGIDTGSSQAIGAIAIGYDTGNIQDSNSIAIGFYARNLYDGAIAIGAFASTSQANAIALGANSDTLLKNAVVINATGASLEADNDGLFIAPIRSNVSSNVLNYDDEITYKPVVVTSSQKVAFNDTKNITKNNYTTKMLADKQINKVISFIKGYPKNDMSYTFGKEKPVIWLATTDTGIKYSVNGRNWNNTNVAGFTYITNIKWNGYMWLASEYVYGRVYYSYNGIDWQFVQIFTGPAGPMSWNGNMWVICRGSTSGPFTENNTVKYSYDGINWNNATADFSLTNLNWRNIIWNGNMWIACKINGQYPLAYSYNGKNWYQITQLSGTQVFSIAWNGTRWVCIGSMTGNVAYSDDGFIWNTGSNGVSSGEVSWGNIWVITSYTNGIKYSYNGKDFINTNITNNVESLFWNGNFWTATKLSSTLISYNGIDWISVTSSGFNSCFNMDINTPHMNTITFPRNVLVAAGTSGIYYSFDAKTWTLANNNSIRSVATDGKKWIAISNNIALMSYNGIDWFSFNFPFDGRIISYGDRWMMSTFDNLYQSFDGFNWFVTLNTYIESMVYNNIWVVAGSSGIYRLKNVWEQTNTNPIRCVAYGNKWLAGSYLLSSQAYIYISDDASNWQIINTTTFPYGVKCLTYNDIWVAGFESGNVRYSNDAITWTATNNTGANSIIWKNVWVSTSPVRTSADGKVWTDALAGEFETLAASGQNYHIEQKLIAVGNGILTSPDGITWQIVDNRTANAVAYNGSMWLAVGNNVLYSYGESWQQTSVSKVCNSVCWAKDKWVAVGDGIIYSANGIDWTIASNLQFNSVYYNSEKLLAVGGANVYQSVDGVSWSSVTTNITDTDFKYVTYSNRWIIVGDKITDIIIISSTNLSDWTTATGSYPKPAKGLISNGIRTVIITDTNSYYSDDTLTWSIATGFIPNTYATLSWSGKRWIAAANTAAYSYDGSVWYAATLPTSIKSITNAIDNPSLSLQKGDTISLTSPPYYSSGVYPSINHRMF
jgi:hypothetical protein